MAAAALSASGRCYAAALLCAPLLLQLLPLPDRSHCSYGNSENSVIAKDRSLHEACVARIEAIDALLVSEKSQLLVARIQLSP